MGWRTQTDQDGTDAERKDLVWMAVDGISRVFEMNVGRSHSVVLTSADVL